MTANDLLNKLSGLIDIDINMLRIILAAAILLIGYICRNIFLRLIMYLLRKIARKTKSNLDDMLIHAFEVPAKYLITGLSIWLALSILPIPLLKYQSFLNICLKMFFAIIIFWLLYRGSDSAMHALEHFINASKKAVNPALVLLLGKVLKILIILLAVFTIIDLLGYDVSGIIAGFGLGGLAISLAAKDAAANFLGSITIMIDKTYSVGELISTDRAEGTVEEIGFRSTKIRTFGDSIVSIPNSIMSNDSVTNLTKRGKRRVSTTLQIPLDTPPEKIKTIINRIREVLYGNEEIDQDYIVVNLNGFENGALGLQIYYFTKTTSWDIYLGVNEDIYLKILQIFKEVGVPITLPAQRVVMEKEIVPESQVDSVKEDQSDE